MTEKFKWDTGGGEGGTPPIGRNINAGNGLTGGGDLSEDVTIDVGQGNGITVGLDAISVRLATPSGLSFSTGDLQLDDSVAGGGLSITNKVLALSLSSTGGLEVVADELKIKLLASTSCLTLAAGGLAVALGEGLEVETNEIHLHLDDYSGLVKATSGVKIDPLVAGDGLTWSNTGNGILAVGAGTLITVAANSVGLSVGSAEYQVPLTGANPYTPAWSTSSANPSGIQILRSDSNSALTLAAINIDTIGNKNLSTNLAINSTGDIVVNPAGKDVVPNANYDINLGSVLKKYATVYAAELLVETLVAQEVIATIGGHILVAPTTILVEALASGDTHMHVKHNTMKSGDRVYLNAWVSGAVQIEWIALTSDPTGSPGNYSHNITRNLDGSGANDWAAGDAVVDTGTTGSGYIDIYSFKSIRSASHIGPTIVGNLRYGTTYSDLIEAWAIGNLNGLYGMGANDIYGVGLGQYHPTLARSYILLDDSNGLRIYSRTGGSSTLRGQWDTAGVITLGATSAEHIIIDATSLKFKNSTTVYGELNASTWTLGVASDKVEIASTGIKMYANSVVRVELTSGGILYLRDTGGNAVLTFNASDGAEITKKLTMPGTSSAISIGSTPPTSATVGTGIWIDRTGIYGLATNVLQAKFDATTGKITAGAGDVILDSGGISIDATSNTDPNKIKWLNGSLTNKIDIYGYVTASATTLNIEAAGDGTYASSIVLSSSISGLSIGTYTYLSLSHSFGVKLVGVSGASADFQLYGGIYVGNVGQTIGGGSITFTGDLASYKNSTAYTGYIFVPLSSPLTSTSWDGDAYSTTAKTVIDLSAVFGAPAGIKAVAIRIITGDSGSAGSNAIYFGVAPNNTSAVLAVCSRPIGIPADYKSEAAGICPCDANGDIYYQCSASGAGTLDVWIQIWGYFI